MSTKPISRTGELAKQCVEDSERWFGDQDMVYSVPHHALAMAGEVGEFCNIVKKVERGSLDLQDASVRVALAMELTDVYVYLLNLAGLLNVDLEESYKIVRGQNETRFMEQRHQREKFAAAKKNHPGATQEGLRIMKDNPQA